MEMHNTEKANVSTGHLELTVAESVGWFSSNMTIILGSLLSKQPNQYTSAYLFSYGC